MKFDVTLFVKLRRFIIESKRPTAWKQASRWYKHDHPACEMCGDSKQLEAHDIYPFHKWPFPDKVSYDEWYLNLISLCHTDHRRHAHCRDPDCMLYQPAIREIAMFIRERFCRR